jgi:hypothetical protein
MQLSASLLPFDLPVAPATVPAPGVNAVAPTSVPGDFGALLTAQSTSPATPTSPAAPPIALTFDETLSEPVVEATAENADEHDEDLEPVLTEIADPAMVISPQHEPSTSTLTVALPAKAAETDPNVESESAAEDDVSLSKEPTTSTINGEGGRTLTSGGSKTPAPTAERIVAHEVGAGPSDVDAAPARPSPMHSQTAPAVVAPGRPTEANGPGEGSGFVEKPKPASAPASTETSQHAASDLSQAEQAVHERRSGNVETAAVLHDSRRVRWASPTAAQPPAEKFAVASARAGQPTLAAYRAMEKTTEVAEEQFVELGATSLGTNAAKPEVHMPASLSHAPSAPLVVERLSQAVAPLTAEFAADERGADSPEWVETARRAVSVAVAVTEQLATQQKPAVTLKFTVSGVDLGVHVELRGENLHTTFRTDSPELRAALAQEWQQVAAVQPGDRAARLAEPVFTTNAPQGGASATSNGSTADFGAADQRGSQHRQDHASAEEWSRFRAPARPTDTVAAHSPSSAASPRSVSAPAAGRLHTFA